MQPVVRPIHERLIEFGAAVIIAVDVLPNTRKWNTIAYQLNRCGTAPAAHYAESLGAESPADYVHKQHICLKELFETDSWLRMANKVQAGVFSAALLKECNELIAITVSTVKKTKRRIVRKDGDGKI